MNDEFTVVAFYQWYLPFGVYQGLLGGKYLEVVHDNCCYCN